MAKEAKGVIVDFSGVESGGGRPRVPEGDYLAEVKSVRQETSKAGNEMFVWEFRLTSGRGTGKTLLARTTITKESLWKLKQLLEAMGKKVPNGKASMNLRSYIGEEVGVTVIDNEYNNRIYSEISDFIAPDMVSNGAVGVDDAADEVEEDEEEEEVEVVAKVKKAKKAKKAPVAVDGTDDEEEIEDIDLDTL